MQLSASIREHAHQLVTVTVSTDSHRMPLTTALVTTTPIKLPEYSFNCSLKTIFRASQWYFSVLKILQVLKFLKFLMIPDMGIVRRKAH